jgi:hypothetical protein
MDKNLSFDEFSKVGLDEWKQRAIQDLKDKSINDLCYVSSDGIKVDSYCCYENSKGTDKILPVDWKIAHLGDGLIKEDGVDSAIISLDELGVDMGRLSLESMLKVKAGKVRFDIGTDFFDNIARIRALRLAYPTLSDKRLQLHRQLLEVQTTYVYYLLTAVVQKKVSV